MGDVTIPLPKLTPEQVERFWSHYNCGESPDDCWIPDFSKDRKGYGKVSFCGKTWLAHRVAYEIFNGPATNHVLHSCDNPPCGNPNHLHEGTNTQNHHECLMRGRWRWKINKEQVEELKSRWANRSAIRVTQRQLSKEYGISQPMVVILLKGESQKWRP